MEEILQHSTTPVKFARVLDTPISTTDQTPTLPELIKLQGKTRRINVAQEIGAQWCFVGIDLLDDQTGAIVPTLAQQHMNNASLISIDILTRWIQGQGMADTSWRGLLGVVKIHCPALAESIEEALMEEEDTDFDSGKWLCTKL